jgi:hypothetical protein
VFVWRSHEHPDNVVKDADGTAMRTCRLLPKQGAQFGKDGEAIFAGNGYFEADEASNHAFAKAWKAAQARAKNASSSNTLVAVEMVVSPESMAEDAGGNLFTFERIRFMQSRYGTHLYAPYFSPTVSGDRILSVNMSGPSSTGDHHLRLGYGFGGSANVVVNRERGRSEPETAIFSEREMGGPTRTRHPERIRFGCPTHEDDAPWRGTIHSIAIYVYANPKSP